MKKPYILSILFSLAIFSCDKEPEPVPEVIRAYCYLYQFVPGLEKVTWEVDDIVVPTNQIYASFLPGAVILESASEEILFTVKHTGTGEILKSRLFTLEEDKDYNVIISGAELDPVLLIQEIETTRPQSGKVKIQMLHAAIFQDSIDVYMGGTTPDKRVVTDMDFKELSDPFEVYDFDVRASITVSVHDETYNQDNLLLTSVYNDLIISNTNYLFVLAPSTIDPLSKLTLWLYDLPTE